VIDATAWICEDISVRVCFKLPSGNIPAGTELNKAVHLLILISLLYCAVGY